MATVSTSTRIEAPQQRVFEIFTDLPAFPSRVQAIDKIEVLTDGPIGKGTRFAETRTMFGRACTETMEFAEWNPPESCAVAAESCGSRYLTRFTFRPDGSGTIVEVTFTATPVRVMAKLMSFMLFFMKNACRKMFERDLADLKAFAENPDAATAAEPTVEPA